ncbi:ATP-binding response regulator [Falsiroseomonas tokyonensis]|uniref:histidine kinase n=1 Tax=Falsiroseomonas tokyonensis TaxID=430521 RepID=A0ABV7BRQ4_9PROT|nr:ATP-binding protein [Falsiroseomonas tokyonensis]MBU8537339.1 PAS domain-containing protein [Falsiroseomonas tokyonensis]
MRDDDGDLIGRAEAGGSYRLDADCRFVTVDAHAAELLGQPAWSLTGSIIWEVLPELRVPLQARFEAVLQGGGASRFVCRLRPVDRWYAAQVDPVGPPQAPAGLMVRFYDATAELGALNDEIVAERLDAAAEATGRLAHDVNNGLTVVLGNAEFLEEELAGRPDLLEVVRLVADAAERLAALTKRVQSFASYRRQGFGQTPPDALLPRMAARLTSNAPDWPVLVACEPDLPPVLVDAEDLEAALSELVLNARAALPDGGPVRLLAQASARPGRVMIAVVDGGCGMPPALSLRCMEPFVTSGSRQGLGLSVVRGFAAAHGATLQIDSDPGAGTIVTLDLPAAAGEAEPPPLRHGAKRPHVLLVDDDANGRTKETRLPDALGCDVIAAAKSRDALEALRQGPRPALLLADAVLPNGAGGALLVEQARRLHPALPAVLISDDAALGSVDSRERASDLPLLEKSFGTSELEQVLSGALER